MKIEMVHGKVDGITCLWEEFIKGLGWFRLIERDTKLFPAQNNSESYYITRCYQMWLDGEPTKCRIFFIYDTRNNYSCCRFSKESKDLLDNAVSSAQIKPRIKTQRL
jgi:hypothetical protein